MHRDRGRSQFQNGPYSQHCDLGFSIPYIDDRIFYFLYEQATSGEGTSTDDIVEKLTEWNDKYGVAVTAADPASITLEFSSLPEDIERFCEEAL